MLLPQSGSIAIGRLPVREGEYTSQLINGIKLIFVILILQIRFSDLLNLLHLL